MPVPGEKTIVIEAHDGDDCVILEMTPEEYFQMIVKTAFQGALASM